MPLELMEEDLETSTREAMEYLEEEEEREVVDLGGQRRERGRRENTMSDGDLACLRRKFPFLADLSDRFVRSQTTGELLKMEATAMKLKMMEQSRDYEDRLASNKMALEDRETAIQAGVDNRWDKLHAARFLGGASCSTGKLWREARKISLNGEKPVGSYDMGSVGMGGFVTSKGWVELHNPSSCKLSLRLFSINNCASKAGSAARGSSKTDEDVDDIVELGEFKLALRTLRVAAAMVMPWNFAFVALENFLIQSNFCHSELVGVENQAKILTQFVDYVLRENSNRWRDNSSFLNTGELKATWDAFFGAKPQSQLAAKSSKRPSSSVADSKPKFIKRTWVDICFDYNVGKCQKAVGTCKSLKGVPLRHVCNYRADKNKPNAYCEKAHQRIGSH